MSPVDFLGEQIAPDGIAAALRGSFGEDRVDGFIDYGPRIDIAYDLSFEMTHFGRLVGRGRIERINDDDGTFDFDLRSIGDDTRRVIGSGWLDLRATGFPWDPTRPRLLLLGAGPGDATFSASKMRTP